MQYNEKVFLKRELGIQGELLNQLEIAIDNSDGGLSKFKLFILDNEDRFKSNLELVHEFTRQLQDESSYTKHMFVTDFNGHRKEEALFKVFNIDINNVVLNKVEELLKNGLTLEDLYDKLIEYRKSYNPLMAVKLISLHRKRKVI